MRWPVERANSWMSNFGQLRRNTYCFIHHRVDQIALAVAIVITVNLVKWADPWSPATLPIGARFMSTIQRQPELVV